MWGGALFNERFLVPPTVTRASAEALLQAREPHLGQVVPLPSLPKLPRHQQVLLVLLGSCSGCSSHSADVDELALKGFSVVAVTTADKLVLGELPKSSIDGEIANDEVVHKLLNAYWTPRFALLDPEHRLLAIQGKGESPTAFLMRCRNESS